MESFGNLFSPVIDTNTGKPKQPVLIRAWKKCTSREYSTHDDGFIHRHEFRAFVKYILLYNSLFQVFDEINVSLCPRLQPRHYTISSSSSVHPTSVHVTVSVLKSTRDDGTEFKGVCSNHLAETNESGKVRVFSRESTFRLPADASKPIIMIGPGTGIAPMRALLQERAHQKKKQKLKVGENVLYFGCKKRELDFIYADELEAFKKAKTLTKMHLAFSREQEKKVYVQHLLAENAKETWKLMEKGGAYIYVCGGVRMGQDVSEALRKIVSSQGDYTNTDAKKYMEQMSSSGRYVQELWA